MDKSYLENQKEETKKYFKFKKRGKKIWKNQWMFQMKKECIQEEQRLERIVVKKDYGIKQYACL